MVLKLINSILTRYKINKILNCLINYEMLHVWMRHNSTQSLFDIADHCMLTKPNSSAEGQVELSISNCENCSLLLDAKLANH